MPAITDANFGAWLVKCDPVNVFDLDGFIADGGEVIDDWSVKGGYRADRMAPGDKIIFWVSGTGNVFERGIYGIGHVTDQVQDASPEDLDADDIGYWLDPDARRAVEFYVPCYIELTGDPLLTHEELKSEGIEGLEVQKMPQGPNPSWVNSDQLERLEGLLEWPKDDGDYVEEITISEGGAGFGDPTRNAIVEAAAMAAVIDHYGSDYKYENVSADKVGWDITFTHKKTKDVFKVEVKGVSGKRPIVLLTANEVAAADEIPEWWLAVVTTALSDPQVTEYTRDEAIQACRVYVWRADMDSLDE